MSSFQHDDDDDYISSEDSEDGANVVENHDARKRMLKLSKTYKNEQLEQFITSFGHDKLIDLSSKNLTNNDMKIIVECVVKKNKCKILNLWKNSFTHESLYLLVDELNTNTTLLELDLSHNAILNSGAMILSKCLSLNTCVLKELDLSSCGINDYGAKYLAQMLTKNRTLEILVLNDNGIADDGLGKIVEALNRNNNILTHLKLESNKYITHKGLKLVLDQLKKQKESKEIYLSNCIINIDEEAKAELQNNAHKNNFLLFL